jgi:poly(3-hydroxybutyrate) depolymerase
MRHGFALLLTFVGIALAAVAAADDAAPLGAYNIDLNQTTVSGISSGAFMAVQFGVAHSEAVRGVAATAGGPYFCVGEDAIRQASASRRALTHCMQGDPSQGTPVPITAAELAARRKTTQRWAAQGLIGPWAALQRQVFWLFHGYNDGIVKKPVSDALERWLSSIAPPSRVFYRDDLPAAHAQISPSCGAGSCQPCAQTGGDFINTCLVAGEAYDPAGAALQMFYGPLQRTATETLHGRLQSFAQDPFVSVRGHAPLLDAGDIAMGETGYVYVPDDCSNGAPCRLHIAFHGCLQSADVLEDRFARLAGFNEWADANRIVVLYPQARKTYGVLTQPANPLGCWDWWGYNDVPFETPGRFATREGDQIATVWRMAQRLAADFVAVPAAPQAGATPTLTLLDVSSTAAALRGVPVSGAYQYRVTRTGGGASADSGPLDEPLFVDRGLKPATAYGWTLHAYDAAGHEIAASVEIDGSTDPAPPPCDPYYSFMSNQTVDAHGNPTDKTCH